MTRKLAKWRGLILRGISRPETGGPITDPSANPELTTLGDSGWLGRGDKEPPASLSQRREDEPFHVSSNCCVIAVIVKMKYQATPYSWGKYCYLLSRPDPRQAKIRFYQPTESRQIRPHWANLGTKQGCWRLVFAGCPAGPRTKDWGTPRR
jgi:hypothetical protein